MKDFFLKVVYSSQKGLYVCPPFRAITALVGAKRKSTLTSLFWMDDCRKGVGLGGTDGDWLSIIFIVFLIALFCSCSVCWCYAWRGLSILSQDYSLSFIVHTISVALFMQSRDINRTCASQHWVCK